MRAADIYTAFREYQRLSYLLLIDVLGIERKPPNRTISWKYDNEIFLAQTLSFVLRASKTGEIDHLADDVQ